MSDIDGFVEKIFIPSPSFLTLHHLLWNQMKVTV